MASKAATDPVWGHRKPFAAIDLEAEIAGVEQVVVMTPRAVDFLASIDEDDFEANMNLVPGIAAPSKNVKPTGAVLTKEDVGKMLNADVAEIKKMFNESLDMDTVVEFQPTEDIYTLHDPIDLGGGVVIKRLEFAPKTYEGARAFHRAETRPEQFRKFVELTATNPDDPDFPLSGDMIFEGMSGFDAAMIAKGFLERMTRKTGRSRRL